MMSRTIPRPRLRWVLLPALAVLVASLAGLAQGAADAPTEPTEAQRQACLADFRRLCPATRPGGGRVRACFEANLADLSPLCRDAYEARRASGG